MDLLHDRCAGLDVHKETVVACVRVVTDGKVKREVRTFGTTTTTLLALAAWLRSEGVEHAVMESTGVLWKPVWHVLEGEGVELVLANARAVRNVPGRKSDMNDAMWLADLLAHGLVSASLVPGEDVQQLRDLTRTRKQLTHDAARHVNRLHKILEDANVKLSLVLSDILGVSGRAMLDAIIAGETDPTTLAKKATSGVKAKREEIVEALRGKVTAHHRFLLKLHLEQYDAIQAAIGTIDKQLEEVARPFSTAIERLEEMPGISRTAALSIMAEAGACIDRFSDPSRLVSFAGVCPRLDESAGQKRSTRTRHAGVWLKSTIVTCAWAAARTKSSYYRAQFLRLKARRGARKAVIAVANSMLRAIFHILQRGTSYQDLGKDFFDRRDREGLTKSLCKRLTDLGYSVELKPVAA